MRILKIRICLEFGYWDLEFPSGKIETIESAIQTGKREGMIVLDDDLQRLVKAGRITPETARDYAKDPAAILGSGRTW